VPAGNRSAPRHLRGTLTPGRALQLLSWRAMPPDAPILLERYELHRSIASGGMATVYLGRRRGDVGFARVVAIKRMHPHLAAEADFVEMFLDEARLASRIRHPNVVPIVDLVASDDEVLLVMEYIAGVPLDDLLERLRARGERAPLRFALRMLSDALHGLDAAHNATDEHGGALRLVHRDVSPHNLLVGADGTTRLIDFGIAKAAGSLHKTRTGQTKGKVGYMPPEQMHGERLDGRSDLYALGLTFWEVLVGARAIDGESEAQMMHRAMTERIPSPYERDADVPEPVSALIMRAVQRERCERFATAEAMAKALDESGAPIASAHALGRWLREVAGEQLDESAELVARVERGAEDVLPVDAIARDDETDGRSVDVAEPGRDTASMGTLSRTVERNSGSWRARAALVALVVGGLGLAWWSGRRSATIPDGAASDTVASAVQSASVVSTTSSAEGLASASSPESPSPSAAASATPSASAAVVSDARVTVPPASSKPATQLAAKPSAAASGPAPDRLLGRH
jgi:serine/threonine protein kinase